MKDGSISPGFHAWEARLIAASDAIVLDAAISDPGSSREKRSNLEGKEEKQWIPWEDL